MGGRVYLPPEDKDPFSSGAFCIVLNHQDLEAFPVGLTLGEVVQLVSVGDPVCYVRKRNGQIVNIHRAFLVRI